jgi:hypothetical protein
MLPSHLQIRCLAFVAPSGTGKTTLLSAVVEVLARRGLRVAVLKATHHHIALDTPGKDSWRHAEAGAKFVGIVGRAARRSSSIAAGRRCQARAGTRTRRMALCVPCWRARSRALRGLLQSGRPAQAARRARRMARRPVAWRGPRGRDRCGLGRQRRRGAPAAPKNCSGPCGRSTLNRSPSRSVSERASPKTAELATRAPQPEAEPCRPSSHSSKPCAFTSGSRTSWSSRRWSSPRRWAKRWSPAKRRWPS